jgi:hypothetical protein
MIGVVPQVLHGIAADGRAVALPIEPAAPGDAVLDGVLLPDSLGSTMNQATAGGHGGGAKPTPATTAPRVIGIGGGGGGDDALADSFRGDIVQLVPSVVAARRAAG